MKTILITGATDGIGRETAKALAADGHRVLIHGRSAEKLDAIAHELGGAATYRADLSRPHEVRALTKAVRADHGRLDVLINNAGVYNAPEAQTADGLDIRFAVNTVAPYVLTRSLLPIVPTEGRIVNLSSAAQAPVDLAALAGDRPLGAGQAYAQSKLALTMWTNALATELGPHGPVAVSVNPGSLLGTKMVREAFGTSGNDVRTGVDILVRAALSDEFADARGRYFDNDAGRFGPPHPDAGDPAKCEAVMRMVETLIT
ncbi:SDR family NAD(P)-dependent oxidoreductase [uncultured Jannaschia sp.]|uniref:SDR family NAD(P)-dependent oxidoreductase n=1 Tax=uncultured Jannaschia sp. TaxID=293347 RepID=UPI002633358E|nr:SDR family NAD(P)-dependent oxidoreductase [uncultured Jannaschia sp.]